MHQVGSIYRVTQQVLDGYLLVKKMENRQIKMRSALLLCKQTFKIFYFWWKYQKYALEKIVILKGFLLI